MAAEFIAEEGPLKGLILALEEGDEWVIGRDPDLCDLVVEDPKVSRRHAICRMTSSGYLLENLSDTNMVLVNDRTISEPSLLKEGDRIQIGSTLFRFSTEPGEVSFFEEPVARLLKQLFHSRRFLKM